MLARELAQSDVAHVFVLRLPDGRVAAFCSCWIVVDELHVNTLVVDLPYRRRGLGVDADALGDRRGGRGAACAARPWRCASRTRPPGRLYETLGFQVVARRPVLAPRDALILWHEPRRRTRLILLATNSVGVTAHRQAERTLAKPDVRRV